MKKIVISILMMLMSTTAFARDQIQIVGSSTVYPFATVVAERLGRGANMKTPVIESTGTGGGMKLLCKGIGVHTPDISNASRKIKDKEIALCKKNGVTDITQVIIGLDGIAFSSSIKGEQYNFTKEQLWKAMADLGPKPTKWSEIDPSLPDYKITIMVPPPTSGTRDAWNSLVMKKGCPKEIKEKHGKKACLNIREDVHVIEMGENDTLIINKLTSDKRYFGIFGFSYLDNNRDKIIAHTIDNTKITLDTIQSGEYAVSRPLYFYVKNAHIGVIPGIDKYVKEFTSEKAKRYLTDVGLVPLPKTTQAITKVK